MAGLLFEAPEALAQSGAVLLQLRPHAGDTLRMRLDQTVEMSGVSGAAESGPVESSTLVMLARLVFETVDAQGTLVTAITDSVRLASVGNPATASVLAWAKSTEGHRFRFRVAPDGSTALTDVSGSPGAAMMLSQMPATLPGTPIAPGATWTRTVSVPMVGTPDADRTATLTATFQFDSLSHSGELAFLTLHGRLSRPPTEARGGKSEGNQVVESSGTVSGQVLFDRRRGWITDAHTTITVRSLIIPTDRKKPPMRVRVTISQWMRAM